MRLKISHHTSYHYDAPVPYGLQQLRLRPKSRPGQEVLKWDIKTDCGKVEVSYDDEHANRVDLIGFSTNEGAFSVICEGEVETENRNGIVGKQAGYVPLWLFQRDTELTRPGPLAHALLREVKTSKDSIETLHDLSANILKKVPFSTQQTSAYLTSEQALGAGCAVCQDHAHIFITMARLMGFPARYISGYLMLNDRVEQTASHAWAEAHLEGLGWVGFDVSNVISPDERYVRVASGLDYRGAAPVTGMRKGGGLESLEVVLQVQQQ